MELREGIMESLDLQQLEWLFFALLGLVLVVVLALIVYVVVANRRQRAKMVQTYEAEKLAPRPARQVAGRVLSLVREEAGGSLQVEVNGLTYGRLADIEDPRIRRQVVEAAMELIQFTGALDQDGVAPAPVEMTDRWREDLRVSSEAELERIHAIDTSKEARPEQPVAEEEIEEQFLNLLTEMGQTPQSIERPGVMRAIQGRLTTRPTSADDSHTFVDEIENIVQRRVALLPALVGRDLHVRLEADASVCFVFEGQEYGNLDDVPNLTARQLIREAIQEWEETA
jgi:hypothetical protein